MAFVNHSSSAALADGYQFPDDESVMQRALQIARPGIGYVEPNPAVGAVIVDSERRLISEGYHQNFGGPHAEIHAIRNARHDVRDAQLFVTLEPCSHQGKTPPCAEAVIQAGFSRVVVGCRDPAPHVAGKGIARLNSAGIEVVEGICHEDATRLIAPFQMLFCQQRPWIHAKWAMTLDGRMAAFTGHSQWISCEESRRYVHQLRGRMDAIITGAGTVRADNPHLTARPPGPRTAIRVVLDAAGSALTVASAMMQTVHSVPVLLCVGPKADVANVTMLQSLGVEILKCPVTDGGRIQLSNVLNELARRRCTNVLLESGSELLGTFFDQQLIDEVHVFIAPKLVGGQNARPVLGGLGLQQIPQMPSLQPFLWSASGDDILCRGDVCR